jgi:hypothetical protein
MQIVVEIFLRESFTIDTAPSDTIREVKNKMYDEKGYLPFDQKLSMYVLDLGNGLINERTLESYNIKEGSTIFLTTSIS